MVVVLPSSGKVVRLEELEASQLSPVSKLPRVPSGPSTPADSAAVTSSIVVSRDSSSMSADTQRHPAGGPSHAHVPPGPAPALPAGAQVQTLEEIEAGLQNMSMLSSPAVNNVNSHVSAAGNDLTAFNKLLHLVNKSQPVADQVCIL